MKKKEKKKGKTKKAQDSYPPNKGIAAEVGNSSSSRGSNGSSAGAKKPHHARKASSHKDMAENEKAAKEEAEKAAKEEAEKQKAAERAEVQRLWAEIKARPPWWKRDLDGNAWFFVQEKGRTG